MSIVTNALIAAVGTASIGAVAFQGGRPPSDVNVVNTPNVNVVGLPAVQIQGTPTVNVGTMPAVSVKDNRQAVAFSYTIESGALSADLPFDQLYEVPAGKRLQLAHVSAVGSTGNGIEIAYIQISARTAGEFHARHFLPIPRPSIVNSDSRVTMNTSLALDMRAEAGDRIGVDVGRTSAFQGSPTAYVTVHFSGYLTDAP